MIIDNIGNIWQKAEALNIIKIIVTDEYTRFVH